MKADDDVIRFVAIGIGINVNMEPEQLPSDIQTVSTSLISESGTTVDRAKLFGKILAEFEGLYKSLIDGDKDNILDKWRQFSIIKGKKISIQTPDRTISGVAGDIDESGALIVRLPDGGHEIVTAGDVTILIK
jgi:BirA family biotin operon repressor/biotin-[acetyl-CoA-carboxylase] ligase